jgi:hypothetical protein
MASEAQALRSDVIPAQAGIQLFAKDLMVVRIFIEQEAKIPL